MNRPLTVLERTFIHINGIGEKRERSLWRSGTRDWAAALASDLSWMGKRAETVKEEAAKSIEKYASGDCAYFSARLSGRDRWRLWPDFKDDCCYLDIETDPYLPTLVGVCHKGKYRVFRRDLDFDEVPDFFGSIRFIATYFGTGFDLPVLRRYFGPKLLENAAHLDTMHVLHSLGIMGGLKVSEEILGIYRPSEITGLSGNDAVRLWHEYKNGREKSLETLIAYNREDVLNLERIMETIAPRLISERMPEQ